MKFIYKCLIVATTITMISCSNNSNFNDAESRLINSGTAETPFRVLDISNEKDSVILRTPGSDFDAIKNNPDFDLFIARLKTTLIKENGVGIAAHQVGVLKNIFLFAKTDTNCDSIFVVINPKIINHSVETICFEGDACLSIPDFVGNSVRYSWIEVEYYNEYGDLISERLEGYSRETGFNAVVFQHEYDHLKGKMFTDKLCDENENTK